MWGTRGTRGMEFPRLLYPRRLRPRRRLRGLGVAGRMRGKEQMGDSMRALEVAGAAMGVVLGDKVGSMRMEELG
jgi:hypothetical protein